MSRTSQGRRAHRITKAGTRGDPAVRVFLSYRRSDASGHAGRLYDALTSQFGRDAVFMDIDTIDAGSDYGRVIDRAIRNCDVLIAVIGPSWLDAIDADGNRRLESPTDLVRLEIETALLSDVAVLPVLVQGAEMPTSDLPGALAGLSRRSALEITDSRWGYDVTRLTTSLERFATDHGTEFELTDPDDAGLAPRPRRASDTSSASRWWRTGAAVIVLAAAASGVAVGTSSGTENKQTRFSNLAVTDTLQLGYPDDWRPVADVQIPGLRLRNSVSLAPVNGQPILVTAGAMRDAAGPTLLPSSFLRRLPEKPRGDDRVALTGTEALRHAGLAPDGLNGTRLTLFSIPTSAGVLGAGCSYGLTATRASRSTCLRIAEGVRLRGAQPSEMGPSKTYAAHLTHTIASIDSVRVKQRSRLQSATDTSEQERIARDIAHAFREGSRQVQRTSTPPRNELANRRLSRSLAAAGAAYERLGLAARKSDSTGYKRARRDLRARESEVSAALEALKPLGYSVT